MKIAVTGASGFIGTHVVNALAGRGVEIVAASRDQTVRPLPEGARHVPLDIGVEPESAYRRLGRPDVLIHLAWSGLPNYLSLHHFEAELAAQYRFLRSLVDSGLRSLLVAGTCYEYGMRCGELDETLSLAPSSPYGFAKATLCRQLLFLRDKVEFGLTWARLFYSYGEGQAPSSLYSQLSAAAARGERRFAMSKGEQIRDFLPIESMARHLVDLAISVPGAGIVNVCSGQPTSVRALVERLLEENGWQLELELGKYLYPPYEPLAFWGSRARLEGLLGLNGPRREE